MHGRSPNCRYISIYLSTSWCLAPNGSLPATDRNIWLLTYRHTLSDSVERFCRKCPLLQFPWPHWAWSTKVDSGGCSVLVCTLLWWASLWLLLVWPLRAHHLPFKLKVGWAWSLFLGREILRQWFRRGSPRCRHSFFCLTFCLTFGTWFCLRRAMCCHRFLRLVRLPLCSNWNILCPFWL